MIKLLQGEKIIVEILGRPILQGVDFHVNKGEILGIIGPNGSGKSTLLRTMLGLIKPKSGLISVENKALHHLKTRERATYLSYVPQATIMDFSFSAFNIIKMGNYIHQNKLHGVNIKAEMIMKELNIWHLKDEDFQTLSGGQKQLVLIAKALMQDTPYLLLDEPISALDISYQLHILNTLKKLTHKGIVIVLHDLDLSLRYCNRLMLLNQGVVECCGKSKDVLTENQIQAAYQVSAIIEYKQKLNFNTITTYLQEG